MLVAKRKPSHVTQSKDKSGKSSCIGERSSVLAVPSNSSCIEPREYDRALYKKRNEIERLFRRLKGFRRTFSRFQRLDVLFLAFINFALIVQALN